MKQEEAINEQQKRRRPNKLFLGGIPVKLEKDDATQKETNHTYWTVKGFKEPNFGD